MIEIAKSKNVKVNERKISPNELQNFVETKISCISTSPERNDTILVEDPFNL